MGPTVLPDQGIDAPDQPQNVRVLAEAVDRDPGFAAHGLSGLFEDGQVAASFIEQLLAPLGVALLRGGDRQKQE